MKTLALALDIQDRQRRPATMRTVVAAQERGAVEYLSKPAQKGD